MFVYREEYYLERGQPEQGTGNQSDDAHERLRELGQAHGRMPQRGRVHHRQAAPWPGRHHQAAIRRRIHALLKPGELQRRQTPITSTKSRCPSSTCISTRSARNYLFLQKKLAKGCGLRGGGQSGLLTALARRRSWRNCIRRIAGIFTCASSEGMAVRAPGRPRDARPRRQRCTCICAERSRGATPRNFIARRLHPSSTAWRISNTGRNFAKRDRRRYPALIQSRYRHEPLGPPAEEAAACLAADKCPEAARYSLPHEHLACGDEREHAKNREQLDNFKT